MKTKVLLFGQLADKAGAPALDVEHSGNLAEVMQQLRIRIPDLRSLPVNIAVNQEIVRDENCPLSENDEIAVMPPFAGG